MPSILQCLTVAVLLASALAAPPPPKAGHGHKFSVKQVGRKRGWRYSGSALTKQVFAKYGKALPVPVAKAAAVQYGRVTATPNDAYDDEYLSPVTIGGQTLNLDFDTGSSDLWVYSSLLPAATQNGHSIYNPARSTTAKLYSGAKWNVAYGDGSSASGSVYFDTVNIGGVTVTSQAVELATKLSSSLTSDIDLDGIVGLSMSTLNTVTPVQQKTFFDNVKGSLGTPMFAVDLKYRAVGTYDFGFIDVSKFTGSITWVTAITSQGFWQFQSLGYNIGTGAAVSSQFTGVMDTGTTLLYLPANIVQAYYAKVAGASNSAQYGGYIYPCTATLPSITISVGSTFRATVPGLYINYGPVSSGSKTCFGGIQSSAGLGFSIFGDIFLKSQYVLFYGGTSPPLIGIASKVLYG